MRQQAYAPSSRDRLKHVACVLPLLAAGLACRGEIAGAPAPFSATGPNVSATAGTPAAPSPAAVSGVDDAAMRAENPDLFAVAEKYFPSTSARGGATRLFRLTRAQLDATTQSLLPDYYQDAVSAAMPRDPLQTNYEYAENLSFNGANFTPYTAWVDKLRERVRAAPGKLLACDAVAPDRACLQSEAEKFLSRAFRGVLSDARRERFVTFFLSSVAEVGYADALADLVAVTLTSPGYVFRDEASLMGTGMGAQLTAAQQLQNITYTLADAPPAALGLADAPPSAYVGTQAALESTLVRVLQSPEAREKLLRFFVAWLEVKEPDEFAIATDVFPEFTPELARAVVAETQQFLEHQLANAAPKLKDITQSSESFVTSALSAIYGRQQRTSSSGPSALDAEQRLGIFTLPAVIASHSGPTTTRLIKRGVFFTRKVMCLPLGLPPPGVNTTLPETDGEVTERERVERATANATCQGCHSVINPFGFMQENYDAIGRWRDEDHGLPIDASMRFTLLDEGPLESKEPVEALRALTSSLRFQQCFARQLFRFYMGRDEQKTDDPTLRQMFFGFADRSEQDIVAMLQTLARSQSFAERVEVKP